MLHFASDIDDDISLHASQHDSDNDDNIVGCDGGGIMTKAILKENYVDDDDNNVFGDDIAGECSKHAITIPVC